MSDTCSKRARMELGGYQLCKLLSELISLCLSFIMDKMVTIMSLLQDLKDWCNM